MQEGRQAPAAHPSCTAAQECTLTTPHSVRVQGSTSGMFVQVKPTMPNDGAQPTAARKREGARSHPRQEAVASSPAVPGWPDA